MPKHCRGNTSLFYNITGNGPPIIFTHGASWDHKQWVKQVDFFKNSHKVITWDVRGHGSSSLPEGIINPDEFSEDLISLINYLELENVVLCGLSMGGHISIQTAIKYPSRVKGLILIGTPCSNSFNLNQRLFIQLNALSSKFIPMTTNAFILAKMLSKQNPTNFEYIYETFLQMPRENWHRIWSAVTRMESKNDLHKIKCPTLILIGDQDIITNFQQPYIHSNIKDSRLKVIPNAHHCTNLDNPDSVNFEVLEFIKNLK